jgi:molybdopterin synthase catalytic subunit
MSRRKGPVGQSVGCRGAVGCPPRHSIERVSLDSPLPGGDIWVELTTDELSMAKVSEWVVRPDCGAFVVFVGTVRDHSEGRNGVIELEYEAYAAQAEPRLVAIASQAASRWTALGRIAIHHRTGTLRLSDYSVMIAVSAAHRGDAFDAAEYCIDTLKRTIPIWKREKWSEGEDWGLDAREIGEVGR